MSLRLLLLSLGLSACVAPGSTKDSNTGSDTGIEDTAGTTDTDTSSTTDTAGVLTQLTLIEGHFFVFIDGRVDEYWLASNNPHEVIRGSAEANGWFYVDAQESAYTTQYTIDVGVEIPLDCEMEWTDDEGDHHGYCWNNGSATEKVFGVASP